MKDPFFVSEFTYFLNDYLQRNPDEDHRRRQNRLILWDKQQDVQMRKEMQSCDVPQKAYVYSTD